MNSIRLTIVSGYNVGQKADYGKHRDGHFCVGRNRSADMVVADKRMSRKHFEIRQKDLIWELKDLGSSNGTRVNEVRVDEICLDNGDVIEAGDTRFRVSIFNQFGSPVVGAKRTSADSEGDASVSSNRSK